MRYFILEARGEGREQGTAKAKRCSSVLYMVFLFFFFVRAFSFSFLFLLSLVHLRRRLFLSFFSFRHGLAPKRNRQPSVHFLLSFPLFFLVSIFSFLRFLRFLRFSVVFSSPCDALGTDLGPWFGGPWRSWSPFPSLDEPVIYPIPLPYFISLMTLCYTHTPTPGGSIFAPSQRSVVHFHRPLYSILAL